MGAWPLSSVTDYLSYAHFYCYKQSYGDSCEMHIGVCVVAVCISDPVARVGLDAIGRGIKRGRREQR
jgi:hypothetical protein